MSRLLRVSVSLLFVLLVLTALPIVAQVSSANRSTTGLKSTTLQQQLQHGVRWKDSRSGEGKFGNSLTPGTAPAGAHLTYYGGPVISNVHIVEVLYGAGSYDPQVAGTSTPTLGNFFSDITNSGFISLLTQYSTDITSTPGTNQSIGTGTFDGVYQITPSTANSGTTIDDTQIEAELIAQITAGHLPPPVVDAAGDVNTVYMIYFPPGVTTTDGGSTSCVTGGYCAYHGATSNTYNGLNLLYGIFPDMQPGSGCYTGCGSSPTVYGNYTSVSSHELAEAITDPMVSLAFTTASPLAWYDSVNGEIGDICNSEQGSYVANGTTYTLQYEFSNAANNCVLPPAGGPPDFSMSVSPTDLSVTQGSSGTNTVTITGINGFVGSVSLSASGLPSGVTATFASNPATSSSLVSFAASSTATTGTVMVTITGVSGVLAHTATFSLTINSAVTKQLLGDPGFEKGYHGHPWTTTPNVLNNSSLQPPHSGKWDAWLDGYGRSHTDTVTQTVTIPSNFGTATLSFWLHIDTAETTTSIAYDTLQVQVLNTSGTVLATLGTFSNLNHASGYQQHSFSMNSFIGQTVQIRFKGVEDSSLQTSFVIDDTALIVQ